jgi:hypothetical protein
MDELTSTYGTQRTHEITSSVTVERRPSSGLSVRANL